jgi:hypothetical protein
VKRRPRKKAAHQKPQPTPAQIRRYLECVADEHQQAWHHELMGEAPQWVYLIGLHLRMIELEHMDVAAEEFL